MASITLGTQTYDVGDTESLTSVSKPQRDYIVLLATQAGAKYGVPTDEQVAVLDDLKYQHASVLIEALKVLAKEVKNEEAQRERERYTRLPNNIGEKTLIDGVVEFKTWVVNDYGGSRMITVIVDDKYRVTMFTNAEWASATNIGDVVSIVGTVKAHREYKGAWSTTLSRPSLKSITHPSEEENA